MPIASKLLYFQRRPSPAPPEPPDPRRRPCRGASASAPRRQRSSAVSHHHHHHHKPVQDLVPANQRDGAKLMGCAGNKLEHIGVACSSSRLNRSVSDHGRLPDAVQQARERLLQRLNSVDLSGRRENTSCSETIWAGVVTHPADIGVSNLSDSELGSLTSYFQSSVSITTYNEVQETFPEPFSTVDKCMPVTPCTEPIPVLQETACEDVEEGENTGPSLECSICLERCGEADGLMQLRCKHVFHSACLERWLRSHGDCPCCRGSVLLTSDE
ncbi:probable E3 ubiquitin-protein ligase RHY1A [Triticum dicoccoides]|uniref:probable E3 ubiquitin-protein ligase RHY1A n=1 Tax=Triticum dicoccoides TaxID=85692 RepID=UPI000E7CAB84|nr:probable E3 ubiquitin-protein ligase RHY1A [Triticum dicoccoides]